MVKYVSKIFHLVVLCIPVHFAVADDGAISYVDALESGRINLPASETYHVDLSGYRMPQNAELLILHVMDTPLSHYYYQALNSDERQYSLSAGTLKASSGSPAFSGFKAGNRAFLIVGKEAQEGSIDSGLIHAFDSLLLVVE